MSPQDLLNIVTISISTILSVGAIILSIWFYRESNKQNKETGLMQVDIRNAISKLEHLYDRTFTDTFGALKNQMDAMQKHIFTSSVGDTNASEPNQLRFSILGCVTEKNVMSIDELCKNMTGFKRTEITETVYSFHRDKIVDFDGTTIKYLKKNEVTGNIDGQS
ncbi:hypothetical protein [Pedobacter helvus]|uniref:Uncharacterized protein n=1 Tax=Pedobacter helvus TaxID=2563444 RepID=A0ABW9JN01_9SPHI|nr:hypothetical protein [Pedobacter ureilyticus]